MTLLSDRFQPRDAADLAEIVTAAANAGQTLEVIGGGSKREIGRPMTTDAILDLSRLSGIVDYDPAELVLTAHAGTRLIDIEQAVAANNQMLAFDPFDHSVILGGIPYQATIGGVLAGNVSGSRRLAAGAARDHFLGFEGVSGTGEHFKGGSRVVKNVTGYDLPKLLAGSWGTLAVLHLVTIKVMPRPQTETSLILHGLSDQAACQAMAQAMGSTASVMAAAHLPADVSGSAGARTAIRIEGFAPSVQARALALTRLLDGHGEIEMLDHDASWTMWAEIGEARHLSTDTPLWRISATPSHAWRMTEGLHEAGAKWIYDWAGGLIWLTAPIEAATMIRERAAIVGASAVLLRASAEVRRDIGVYPEAPPAVAALNRRTKLAFDPAGILNPGRLAAEAG